MAQWISSSGRVLAVSEPQPETDRRRRLLSRDPACPGTPPMEDRGLAVDPDPCCRCHKLLYAIVSNLPATAPQPKRPCSQRELRSPVATRHQWLFFSLKCFHRSLVQVYSKERFAWRLLATCPPARQGSGQPCPCFMPASTWFSPELLEVFSRVHHLVSTLLGRRGPLHQMFYTDAPNPPGLVSQ